MKFRRWIFAMLVATGTSMLAVVAFAADPIPTCEEAMRYPRSVALEPLPPLRYPSAAYEAGAEGNVVYQYTLAADGSVSIRCIVSGTGSRELDAAVLARVSGAQAILPRDYDYLRDRDVVYQESTVVSYKREFRARRMTQAIDEGPEKFERLKPIYAPTPVYPRESLDKGQEGTVTLMAVFDGAGHVGEVRVIQSSGYPLLDGSAMAAMAFVQLPASGASVRVQRTFNFKVR